LQVCGQGESHAQKHGEKQHKRWRSTSLASINCQRRIKSFHGALARNTHKYSLKSCSEKSTECPALNGYPLIIPTRCRF
jgi:hypothetical protein